MAALRRSTAAASSRLTQAARRHNHTDRTGQGGRRCASTASCDSSVTVCTLAVYVGCWPDLPLLVAANRDEFLARPTAEPALLSHQPRVFAGQDLSAGGTWLGINQHGLVAGLLNRRGVSAPDPRRRSRGLLCLEVLQQAGRTTARALLAASDSRAYNPFHLLLVDVHGAEVATHAGDAIHLTALEPGVHVLTNLEIDDPTCPRIAKSWQRFRALTLAAADDPAALIGPLRNILADHSTALDPGAASIDTLCVHRPSYGTRSASVIAVDRHGRQRYWHASGPPCRAPLGELCAWPADEAERAR